MKKKKKIPWHRTTQKLKPRGLGNRNSRARGSIWNWWQPTEPPPTTNFE